MEITFVTVMLGVVFPAALVVVLGRLLYDQMSHMK